MRLTRRILAEAVQPTHLNWPAICSRTAIRPGSRISRMKLITQPDAGVAPVVTAIKQAKKSVNVTIFRHDRDEITRALEAAVGRGVNVRALIAHTHSGSDKALRKLELRLLAAGVTVSRTADDLIRYHGKMMIIDDRVLHVYGFNFTRLDIAKSRSLGVITKNRKLVQEALKLFKADDTRQTYMPGCDRFVISPENARERLAAFISGARKQLLIYDPNVSDDAMLRLIKQRINAGVDLRIIGKAEAKWKIRAEKFPGRRLHVRAIMRDGRRAFLGSQSLRRLELEKRREIGIIINDKRVVRQMIAVFEGDWAQTDSGKKESKRAEKVEKSEKADKKAGREPPLAAVS
jgi:cardiolipin synthase